MNSRTSGPTPGAKYCKEYVKSKDSHRDQFQPKYVEIKAVVNDKKGLFSTLLAFYDNIELACMYHLEAVGTFAIARKAVGA